MRTSKIQENKNFAFFYLLKVVSGPWEIYSRLNFKEHCKLEFILFCLEIFFYNHILFALCKFFSVRTMFMGVGGEAPQPLGL